LLESLSLIDWLLLCIAALGIGLSKSGLAGVGMIHVIVFAYVFDPRLSTGALLPLLIVGDALAILRFGAHARWQTIRQLYPAAMIGVVCGWALMDRIDSKSMSVILGCIILVLTILQAIRLWRPELADYSTQSRKLAWSAGMLTGFTTMIANAAGPVISLYLLATAVPKLEMVGTGSWFFFILNLSKVPFSWQLGLISWESLLINAILSPVVWIGIQTGSAIVHRIPQNAFNALVLALTGLAAIKLIVW
jgi:uncharacterized protein